MHERRLFSFNCSHTHTHTHTHTHVHTHTHTHPTHTHTHTRAHAHTHTHPTHTQHTHTHTSQTPLHPRRRTVRLLKLRAINLRLTPSLSSMSGPTPPPLPTTTSPSSPPPQRYFPRDPTRRCNQMAPLCLHGEGTVRGSHDCHGNGCQYCHGTGSHDCHGNGSHDRLRNWLRSHYSSTTLSLVALPACLWCCLETKRLSEADKKC